MYCIWKCPEQDTYLNRWSSKKNYNFNQIPASTVCRHWVLLKLKIPVVGGLGERYPAGGVLQCNYPSLTGISVATVIIFPRKEEINLYRCIWGAGDCPEEKKRKEERHSGERRAVKIEDGWLVIGLHARLVCLFVWLAAVRLHSGERHNEKACLWIQLIIIVFYYCVQNKSPVSLYLHTSCKCMFCLAVFWK